MEACQMLPVLTHRNCRTPAGSGPKMENKSNDILKAIDAGHSCEEILASDHALTYHDIFHALTEAPTSHWKKTSARRTGTGMPGEAASVRAPAKHRKD
jgi:hypothetical protein